MSRCSKCNGCTSMWSSYRPHWCDDEDCPEGKEDPDKAARKAELDRLFTNRKKEEV